LKKSYGLTEQSVHVVSSVATVTVGPSLNLTKKRLLVALWGPREFYENGK